MYDDKPLKDDLTLIDIAYIFAWRAKVMRVFFSLTHPSLKGRMTTMMMIGGCST